MARSAGQDDELELAPEVAEAARRIREEGFVDRKGKLHKPWDRATDLIRDGIRPIPKKDRLGAILDRIASTEDSGLDPGFYRDLD
jgi:hypothetical protein